MKEQFEELVAHLMEKGFFLEEAVELLERTLIERALRNCGGNQSAASKVLGIHRNTLQRKIVYYRLDGRPARKPPAAVKKTRSKARRKSS